MVVLKGMNWIEVGRCGKEGAAWGKQRGTGGLRKKKT